MRVTSRRYASLTTIALVLLVCLAALPMGASAQGPSITIFGTGTDRCPDTGRPVAAGRQGTAFQVGMANFPAASVYITLTAPDGRVFDVSGELPAAGTPFPDPPFPPAGGVAQLPLAAIAHNPVDAEAVIQTTRAWPTGCYTVNVISATPQPPAVPPAPAQTVRASATFRLQPFAFPAQPANLQLTAQATGTIQPTAVQPFVPDAPVSVSIFGRATLGALPTLSLIRPDGAIIAVPAPALSGSPGGFFNTTYPLPAGSPTGVYTFVATVPPGDLALATASTQTQFTLSAPPSAATGNAVLSMEPFSTLVRHSPLPSATAPTVTIAGRGLPPPTTVITGVLVLPNGSRIAGALPAVNASGNLGAFTFALQRVYPTGAYRFEVIGSPPVPFGAPAAPPAVLGSISWRMTP